MLSWQSTLRPGRERTCSSFHTFQPTNAGNRRDKMRLLSSQMHQLSYPKVFKRVLPSRKFKNSIFCIFLFAGVLPFRNLKNSIFFLHHLIIWGFEKVSLKYYGSITVWKLRKFDIVIIRGFEKVALKINAFLGHPYIFIIGIDENRPRCFYPSNIRPSTNCHTKSFSLQLSLSLCHYSNVLHD